MNDGDWTGDERRRDPPLEHVREELARLRVTLLDIAQMVVPRAEVEAKLWTLRRHTVVGVILATAVVLILGGLSLNNQAIMKAQQHIIEDVISNGVLCTIEQLAQHRDTNEIAHQTNAKEHGYNYTAPPDEYPPPVPEKLKAACREFFKHSGLAEPKF